MKNPFLLTVSCLLSSFLETPRPIEEVRAQAGRDINAHKGQKKKKEGALLEGLLQIQSLF